MVAILENENHSQKTATVCSHGDEFREHEGQSAGRLLSLPWRRLSRLIYRGWKDIRRIDDVGRSLIDGHCLTPRHPTTVCTSSGITAFARVNHPDHGTRRQGKPAGIPHDPDGAQDWQPVVLGERDRRRGLYAWTILRGGCNSIFPESRSGAPFRRCSVLPGG